MSFSGSSPCGLSSLRRGVGLFGTARPEPSSAQQAFLPGSLQQSSHQPPPAPRRGPRAPVTVQHRYTHGISEGFFPFVSLLDTCLSRSFLNLFFLIYGVFFSFFSPLMPFACLVAVRTKHPLFCQLSKLCSKQDKSSPSLSLLCRGLHSR